MKLIIDIPEDYYEVIKKIDDDMCTADMLIIKYGKSFNEELQEIRQKIENNMESIIGRYDASTPEHNRPSHKIERNNGRKECIDIIDKHIKQIEGSGTE